MPQDLDGNPKIGFDHPDAERRFALVHDSSTLSAALEFPWERWTIFLHPDQKVFSEINYEGAARVSGSAGTGKTIVAIQRAYHLHKKNPDRKILVTTFTKTLANSLQQKMFRLLCDNPEAQRQIEVRHLEGFAFDLLKKAGSQPSIASKTQVLSFLRTSAESLQINDFSIGFLLSEWENVIDAWGIKSLKEYSKISRLGRQSRLGLNQRSKLWAIFKNTLLILADRKLSSWSSVFLKLSENNNAQHDFSHIIVDEAQDISVPELKFLANTMGQKENGLFFAGDLGQRIFRQPFSWKQLGIDIRGKSLTLRVNYRTSQQIRKQADLLLTKQLTDLDNNSESRLGTISIFQGDRPKIILLDNEKEEIEFVQKWIVNQVHAGIKPFEIGVFVRSDQQYQRALTAIKESGNTAVVLNYKLDGDESAVNYGNMHLAKGLEYRSVVVMACDQDVLPLKDRLNLFSEPVDIEEVERTERHLLYVACTRARENLLVTGVGVGSKFLYELIN